MEQLSSFSGRLQELRKEPRAIRGEHVRALKKEIETLDEEATALIDDLWRASLEHPSPSAEHLLRRALRKPISPSIEIRVRTALEKYRDQQARLEEILDEFPDPRELFEACFGVVPTGRVSLTRSAITLNLIIFSDEDYIKAYTLGSAQDPDQYIAQRAFALQSGGCALSKTNLLGSEGIFTLVRVGSNREWRRTKSIVEEEREIPAGKNTDAQDLVHVSIDGPDYSGTVDYTWSRGDFSVKNAHAFVDTSAYKATVADETSNESLSVDELEVRITSRKTYEAFVIRTDMLSGHSRLFNQTDGAIHLTLSSYEKELHIHDPAQIKTTLAHEVQHQWNKLFSPTDPTPKLPKETIEKIIASHPSTPKEGLRAVLDFIFDRTRRDTQLGDAYHRAEIRGRDEILAFYRDGRRVKDIGNYLRIPLYDYFGKDRVMALKKEILSHVKKYHYLLRDIIPDAPLVHFSDAEIDAYIDGLKKHYFLSLDAGLRAIERLESKGMSRHRIVAKLYKANLTEWPSIARRFVSLHLQT